MIPAGRFNPEFTMNHYNSFNELAAGQDGGGRASDFNPVQNEAVENMSPPLIPDVPVAGYEFFIGTSEGFKPHVHVKAGDKEAKFWLNPLSVKDKGNMRPDELNAAMKYVEPNQDTFIKQYRKEFPLPNEQKQKEQYDGKTIPKSSQESGRKQRRGRTYQQPDSIQPDS